MRILLADDHEAVRKGLRALLESRREWRICGEAEDGQDAVEKAEQLKPDLVILDLSMPKLSGFGAARRIRECCPGVPILIYSMHRSRAFLEEARRVGVTGYVSKSENSSTFLDAVDAVQHHQPFFAA
ncbi:MAG TPA: response regulator transcription factor [Candidatus Cybelea sp.]|nr:response regulator transcription factor [Candidatus Cybelea sp.]